MQKTRVQPNKENESSKMLQQNKACVICRGKKVRGKKFFLHYFSLSLSFPYPRFLKTNEKDPSEVRGERKEFNNPIKI